jgi:CDP-2,3-bis-(O-geranylgeranyl)-sn-glycerol synthase
MWTSWGEVAILGARTLWLAAPLMLAAALHVVVLRFRFLEALKRPLDLGATVRGHRLFGDHKTWRGAVVMTGGAALGMALQQAHRVPALELFDYGAVDAWLVGALLGLGFVVAELPNSFLKRQLGVPPGQQATGAAAYWCLTALDQVDSVLGGLLALAFVWRPPWPVVAAALVLGSLAHVGFNLVFVAVGLKRRAL